jgi:putative ABC transport system ATP-binding protein
MEIFEQLHNAGNTIILITHEEYIAKHSQRIIKLLDGLIQSDEKLN